MYIKYIVKILINEILKELKFTLYVAKYSKIILISFSFRSTKAVDMAYYLGYILSQVLYNADTNVIPIELVVDSYSLYENVYSTKNVTEKRLRIDLAILKQMIHEGDLKIMWTDSKGQLADVLTKRGVNSFKLMKAFEIRSLNL